MTVNECRILWVTLLKTQVPVYRPEMDAYSEDDWDKMMQDGQWNQELGDLMPFAVAFGTKKRILIWHCYEEAIDPVSIVEPEAFGQARDSDIPICIAYNYNHYESIEPVGPTEVPKTVELFNSIKNQTVTFPDCDMIAPLSGTLRNKKSKMMKALGVSQEMTAMTPEQRKQRNTENKQRARKASGEKEKEEQRRRNTERMQRDRKASGEEEQEEQRRRNTQ